MENFSPQQTQNLEASGEIALANNVYPRPDFRCNLQQRPAYQHFSSTQAYLPNTQIQFSRSDMGMSGYFGHQNNHIFQFRYYDPHGTPFQQHTRPHMMSAPDFYQSPRYGVQFENPQSTNLDWDHYWSVYFGNDRFRFQMRQNYDFRDHVDTRPPERYRQRSEPAEEYRAPNTRQNPTERPESRERTAPSEDDRYTRRESDNGRTVIQVRAGESIQSAMDRAPAGAIIRVMPGTYRERLRITKDNITLQGEQGAILDYSGTSISGGAIQISDRQNVRIEGFEIRNIRGGSTPTAIRVDGASRNISIINNDIHHVESSSNAHAIGVFGTKSTAIQNVVIAGNRVHDLKLGQSEAVVLNGNVDGFKILQNKIYNTDNIAIDIIGGEGVGRAGIDRARNGLIARNEITNVDSRRNPTYRSACAAGIYVDGGSDVIIEENVVKNANYGIELASERRGWRTERIQVRRNRLESNNLAGISLGGGSSSNGGVHEVTIEGNEFKSNARGIWRQNNIGNITVRNNNGA